LQRGRKEKHAEALSSCTKSKQERWELKLRVEKAAVGILDV
jgi:hypothetical protein